MGKTVDKSIVCKRLGERIRTLRYIQDLTQDRFAEMVGIARTYLNELENGKRVPSLTTLLKISEGLNVTLSELLEGVDRI